MRKDKEKGAKPDNPGRLVAQYSVADDGGKYQQAIPAPQRQETDEEAEKPMSLETSQEA